MTRKVDKELAEKGGKQARAGEMEREWVLTSDPMALIAGGILI